MMLKKILSAMAWCLTLIFPVSVRSQAVVYPVADQRDLNKNIMLSVRYQHGRWQQVPVYRVMVARNSDAGRKPETAAYSYFDFKGAVSVKVVLKQSMIRSARIRPGTAIPYKIQGNALYFELNSPKKLSIELNGDIFHNLHLFTSGPDIGPSDRSEPNLLYYGPGVHEAGVVNVPSNSKVYLAGGAVVHGTFRMTNVHDIRIWGRGIIANAPGAINIDHGKNIVISGIAMINPPHNSIGIASSENIKVSNFKSFSHNAWGDGIDIVCSKKVVLDSVFLRNSDDCIAIYGHRGQHYGNVNEVKVSHSTVWADVAHPLFMGTHGDPVDPDTLSNISFTDIDILDHCEYQIDYQGCMAINAGDDNVLQGITFDNIRVDDFRHGQLINLRIMYNKKYNQSPGRAIKDVTFSNISYKGNHAAMSVISGYNEQRMIEGITFKNLSINGRLIYDTMPGKQSFYKTGDLGNILIGEHVGKIQFEK